MEPKGGRASARALAADPQHGTFIALRGVPKETLRRWHARVGAVANLWKLDLPEGWRALYTVGSDGPLRVALVLEVLSQKEYDRLLGSK